METMILICFISIITLLKINLFCELEIRTHKWGNTYGEEREERCNVLLDQGLTLLKLTKSHK
jgi:hypothetical protein